MEKKNYKKPKMQVYDIEIANIICNSTFTNIDSNIPLDYGGGDSGQAR